MDNTPKPFERYRHFKGKLYQVLMLAKDADDGKDLVIYQALYDLYQTYVLSLEEFVGEIDPVKYPDAVQRERFKRVGDFQTMESAPLYEYHPEPSVLEETSPTADAGINPSLMLFLEAETVQEKMEVLRGIREVLTPEILIPIELTLGIESQEDLSVDERDQNIRFHLQTKEKYERQRRE